MEQTLWLPGVSGPEPLVVRLTAPPDAGRPALLYLHGFGSDQAGEKAATFRSRAAAARIAFCSFDFRGHGRSGGGMEHLTMTRNLEDAEAALAWLAGRWAGPIAFFGSSMGGATAMWLAATRPEGPARRLCAGVAIAPALGLERSLARRVGTGGLERWRSTGRLAVDDGGLSCELGWELMTDLAAHPASSLAPLYTTPTLVFQGTADDSVPWEETADFAAACRPGVVDLHLFTGADHRLIAEKEEIWRLAAGFVARRASDEVGTRLAPGSGEEAR
ncbi:MAG TPA: alpha/beta fold hydrolase [Thermoanaerobaculia bacterium]|nr:alpha/beta fold hydrolase [Thermoanaerobaculia bacterium]